MHLYQHLYLGGRLFAAHELRSALVARLLVFWARLLGVVGLEEVGRLGTGQLRAQVLDFLLERLDLGT